MAKKPSKKAEKLIDFITNDCAASNIKIEFRMVEWFDDGLLGSFCEEDREIVIAARNPNYLSVLAHEYSHMLQMKDGVFTDEKPYLIFADWLTHKVDADMATIISHTRSIQNCEADAEIRALELMKRFGVLNAAGRKIYTQRANAYILMWEIARRMRRWSKSNTSPTLTKKYYELLPTKIIEDFGRVPDDFEAIIVDECF